MRNIQLLTVLIFLGLLSMTYLDASAKWLGCLIVAVAIGVALEYFCYGFELFWRNLKRLL